MGRLDGRVAIVTGAADGPKASLGAAFARRLAADGASVVAVDLADTASVVAAITADGGAATGLSCDISDPAAAREAAAAAIDAFGRIDIIVNNAAIGSNIPPIAMDQIDSDLWDRTMAVNTRGLLLCVQATAPHMAERGYGKIINLGSPMVLNGGANRLHYAASKGAVHAMTRSLSTELGPMGIRVNTLTPGLPCTPFNKAGWDRNPGFEDRLLQGRALRRHVYPEDICNILSLLASPESDAITGQQLLVDCGSLFV